MQVSTADLAVALGISERRIQQLENQGVLRKLEHGEWDLAEAVQGYIRHRLKAKPRPRSDGAGAEAKLKTAKAAREELKLGVERAELVHIDELVAMIDEAVGTFRADLAGIPARLTREVAWREKIETEIDGALNRCAAKFDQRVARLEAARAAEPGPAEADPGPVGSGEP